MTIHAERMGEQPIFTCKAHVFHIDPKTKRSWLPASSAAVTVSFFYDSSRGLYRIISVEGTKAVINSTITPNMTFTKTSQKFGQWSDVRANTVYGLGFSSEPELNKFIEKFNEVKEATRTATKPNGTTPTTSASASPVATRGAKNDAYPPADNELQAPPSAPPQQAMYTPTPQQQPQANQNELVNSNILKTQLAAHQRSQSLTGSQQGDGDSRRPSTAKPSPSPGPTSAEHKLVELANEEGQPQDSPKKSVTMVEKGPAPTPPLSGEAQLKYENDRLKLALAQSSANAKKWEVELATLKNNNSRLTSALQESTANVEEWKRQLHSYKEENTRLKMGLIELEAGRGNCDFNAMAELRNLKSRIEELENDLRERDDEVKGLKEQSAALKAGSVANGEEPEAMKNLQMENDALKKTLEKVQSQLDTSLDAQDQQRKVLEAINRQFGDHLHSLGTLHNELSAVLNA